MIRDRIKNLRTTRELNNDNDTPKDIMDKAMKMRDIIEQNKQLREENEKLRECVEFYANPNTYDFDNNDMGNDEENLRFFECQSGSNIWLSRTPDGKDHNELCEGYIGGRKARELLKEIGGSGE